MQLVERIIKSLCFAGDQIFMAQNADDIEYMTRKVNEGYTKWEVEVNTQKLGYARTLS